MTRWMLRSYPSETGRGHWFALSRIRRLDRGAGACGISFLAGADADVPWRPWPRIWVERRPTGGILVAVLIAGIGMSVLISRHRRTP